MENANNLYSRPGFNKIKKIVAMIGEKDWQCESLVTSLLAVMLNRKGYKVGILDTNIMKPSIPSLFGLEGVVEYNKFGALPVKTRDGIAIMVLTPFFEGRNIPIILEEQVVSGMIKQVWADSVWGDLDILFIDITLGVDCIPLAVFQSIPLDGVIVTSPKYILTKLLKKLIDLLTRKAYNIDELLEIPVIGFIENMSYLTCPDCGEQIDLCNTYRTNDAVAETGLELIGRIPIDLQISELCRNGKVEGFSNEYLGESVKNIEKLLKDIA